MTRQQRWHEQTLPGDNVVMEDIPVTSACPKCRSRWLLLLSDGYFPGTTAKEPMQRALSIVGRQTEQRNESYLAFGDVVHGVRERRALDVVFRVVLAEEARVDVETGIGHGDNLVCKKVSERSRLKEINGVAQEPTDASASCDDLTKDTASSLLRMFSAR